MNLPKHHHQQEINQSLAKHNNFSKISVYPAGPRPYCSYKLTSQIGREEPNKVTLTGYANLDMNSLFGSQKATMKLKLKALPCLIRKRCDLPERDGSGRCDETTGKKCKR
ncbi:DUF1439 domain-containing protein [Escherichia coli]